MAARAVVLTGMPARIGRAPGAETARERLDIEAVPDRGAVLRTARGVGSGAL